jgi:hypothetical protein
MVSLKWISTALGLLAVTATASAWGQGVPSQNQATADRVAGALRSSATLRSAQISIETQDGLVTLSGNLASPALKAEALARTQRVTGVTAVLDRLQVAGEGAVRRTQYQPSPMMGRQPTQVAMGGLFHHNRGGGPAYEDGGMSGPAMEGSAMPMSNGPLPEGVAGGGSPAAMPGNPNYAWPSYAPYPNFSAVGYPTVYPWQAWPNIGPFYPYPEVPLDWRAVTLRWDDGLWWLDFRKHYTRPFFTPYPFGLFAY